MNLAKKKELASRTLGVGKDKIKFNTNRIAEIKEAITKQDIRDLVAQKAIFILDPQGRRKVEARGRRRAGSIRKKVKPGKTHYVRTARNLRKVIATLRTQGKLTPEHVQKLRNEVRARSVRTKSHLTERINLLTK